MGTASSVPESNGVGGGYPSDFPIRPHRGLKPVSLLLCVLLAGFTADRWGRRRVSVSSAPRTMAGIASPAREAIAKLR
jgi:hypothetical protein